MKKIFAILAITLATFTWAKADDRPVTFDQLPNAAKTFIKNTYPNEKISFATIDDDLIKPDYNVVLASGIKIQFENNGTLEKIESRAGVPAKVVPTQITDYVKAHYPGVTIVEYEVSRFVYEVKLSNRLEINFNHNFKPVRYDD